MMAYGNWKKYNIKELCAELSISVATGKNWVRLNKIQPDLYEDGKAMFYEESVNQIKRDIMLGNMDVLRSRRNKSFVSGNKFYSSYISEDSPNYPLICELVARLGEDGTGIHDRQLRYVLAYVIEYLLEKQNICEHVVTNIAFDLIVDFYKEYYSWKTYTWLKEYDFQYVKGEDLLGLLYISLRSLNDRKNTGAYYTPTKIVKKLINGIKIFGEDYNRQSKYWKNIRILDPCCGTGNFLLQLPDDVPLDSIYGFDIDPISVALTRANMALRYSYRFDEENCEKGSNRYILYSNFQERSFLGSLSYYNFKKFDYIIGNPPWGAEIDSSERQELSKKFLTARRKNIESYDLFVEKSVQMLKPYGRMAFVLPEAVLNVGSHKVARQIMQDSCSVERVSYLGEVFDGVNCPSVILQMRKTDKSGRVVGAHIEKNGKSYVIRERRELDASKWAFDADDKEYKLLDKLMNVKGGVTLKGNAVFAMGIVTGNNKKYLKDIKGEELIEEWVKGMEPIYRGSDIEPYRICPTHTYTDFANSEYQQVASEDVYRAPEKLLYRFISNRPIFAYDDKQRLTLNSCNIVIPQIDGVEIKYILAVLNSRASIFMFRKLFDSVKVLKSHIESVPIPVVDDAKRKRIVGMVDELMLLAENDNERYIEIYNKLDEEIAKAYGVSAKEYAMLTQKR